MQLAKDSFYVALRERLAQINPERTVEREGVLRAAVLVTENEAISGEGLPSDCFCLSFGVAGVASGWARAERPMMTLECEITYHTAGTATDGSDRGRTLGALDAELLQMCEAGSAAKRDYRQVPATELGTNVVWLRPQLGQVTEDGGSLQRSARVKLWFFPEVGA